MALREHANDQGGKSNHEEYDSVMVKRKEVMNRWREKPRLDIGRLSTFHLQDVAPAWA